MVVFFDIDGTIIDNETQVIPESAVRAVRQLRDNGHLPIVNTGRPYSQIDPRIRELAFSGWVCGCGMQVILNGEFLHRDIPSPEACLEISTAVRECGMQVLYEPEEPALLYDEGYSDHPALRREMDQMLRKDFEMLPLDRAHPRYLKLVTFDWEGCRREDFIRRAEPYFTCIRRENTMLELVLKGNSKAAGMERLLAHLGVSREDTMAIGDSTNDLPMFAVAKHTVCLAEGADELKAQAEYVTDTVLNDGIEKALKHYRLI